MVDEVALLLPDPAKQLLKICPVVKLIKKTDKEIDITSSVNEMSPWSLIFWLPDLQSHSLREYLLRQFMLRTCGSRFILAVIVENMRSLERSVDDNAIEMDANVPLPRYGDASSIYRHSSDSSGPLGYMAAKPQDLLLVAILYGPRELSLEYCYLQ